MSNSGEHKFEKPSKKEVPDKSFRQEIKDDVAKLRSHAIDYCNGDLHKDYLVEMVKVILNKLK